MASESAFNTEKLVASEFGQSHKVGPWSIELQKVTPVAGANWTALQARLVARYGDSNVQTVLEPQARMFSSPPTATQRAALLTRWNGQLYVVLGEEGEDGRWQLRLWWKPFVPLIWYGGLMIGLGGILALVGRTARDLRRKDQPELEPVAAPAAGPHPAGGKEALA